MIDEAEQASAPTQQPTQQPTQANTNTSAVSTDNSTSFTPPASTIDANNNTSDEHSGTPKDTLQVRFAPSTPTTHTMSRGTSAFQRSRTRITSDNGDQPLTSFGRQSTAYREFFLSSLHRFFLFSLSPRLSNSSVDV
jgi:Flp pilus assembly protein TadG